MPWNFSMLQSNVPLQIISPAYLSTPCKRADTFFSWHLLPKSIVLMRCPEVAVDGPRLCTPLVAGRYGALVRE